MENTFDSKTFMDKYTYRGKDLGAVYTKKETVFKVWSPAAETVTLNLYCTGSDAEEGAGLIDRLEMTLGENGVWQKSVQGDLKATYYTYTVCVDGISRETADVYTKACGLNGYRSMVADLRRTDPEDFRGNEEWRMMRHELVKCPVIYELHIKDFSNDSASGISEANRGKYLAFTETSTTFGQKGEIPTGISYLKTLGVTHIHLLPFFDYGSVDEGGDLKKQFNWGYDPVHYNVPEGSYSSDPYHGEVRIRECKQMIQALHKAGLAVVMDVVYNHTFSEDSVFQRTMPDYYYRKEKDGSFANGSLCGNDTASERMMYRRYMIDSVCYWAEEYQIDGFRFDLMGLHDTETMNEIRAALDKLPGGEDILMYGEPWSGDYSPMREGCVPAIKEHINQLHERIAIFCDNTRDAIKGDVFIADEAGFVNGGPDLDEAIKDSVSAWCRRKQDSVTPKNPGQIISYVSAHDNYTLWDKLACTLPENMNKNRKQIDFSGKHPEIIKQNKMAAGIYFTCLGMVFFQAGEEFGRTKQGLSDSYNAPPELNELSWKRCMAFGELVDFYRGLIRFRKKWQVFYGREAKTVKVRFENTGTPGLIAWQMETEDGGKSLFVIYNRNKEKAILPVPKGNWQVICDGDTVTNDSDRSIKVSEQILVKNEAVMILARMEQPIAEYQQNIWKSGE